MKTSTSMVLGRLVSVHPDEQVVTGEAVALELRLAGVGSRGVAAIIDIAVVTFAEVLLLIVLLVVAGAGANGDAIGALLLVLLVGITLGYPVAMETLWRGRTLGKATMGLRVVRDDGGPIRFRHAFVRGLVGVVLDKPGLTQGLAAFIPMLASSRKKRLGDYLAGTIVLQERVPGNINATVVMPPSLAGWAGGLDLSGVDDALGLRLRQFFGRAAQLTPDARATLEHQLAGEVVAKVGAPPPGTPAWAVISAVLAERRRRALITMQPAVVSPPWGAVRQPWGAPQLAESANPATTGTPEAEPPASTTGFVLPG